MPTRVLFVGLDAMDVVTVDRLIAAGELPTLRGLHAVAATAPTEPPAGFWVSALWPSTWTGLTPDHHRNHCYATLVAGSYDVADFDIRTTRGVPLWDRLADAGRSVAALDVPHSFPSPDPDVWLAVEWGPHDHNLTPSAQPAAFTELIARHQPHPLPGPCDLQYHAAPHRRSPAEWQRLRDDLTVGLERRADVTTDLLGQRAWDLVWIDVSETHCVGHQAWSLHDRSHRLHDPAVAAVVDPVADVYRATDAALGRMLDAAGPDAIALVLLSHGMGPYQSGAHLLDRTLRRLERFDAAGVQGSPPARALKRALLHAPARATARAARLASGRARRRPPPVDEDLFALDVRTRPWFVVPNNSLFGGVRLNLVDREPCGVVEPGTDEAALLRRLLDGLSRLVNPASGRPSVAEAWITADRYERTPDDVLPDVVVEWDVDTSHDEIWSPEIGLIRDPYRHIRTGDHRPHGRLLVQAPGRPGRLLDVTVHHVDLAPTLAALLDVHLDGVDGRPVPELLAQAG